MNPQRIEEFRRKLREGNAVRVVDGRVWIGDGSPGQAPSEAAPQGPNGTPPAAVPAEASGVQVKPHVWGSNEVVSEAFYLRPEGEKRALSEQALLAREYPGFVLDVDDDGTPFAHGHIGPTPELRGRYHVLIVLPPGYGAGMPPRAYVLEPQIRPGAPHLFQDGSLCLDHSGAFTQKSTLVTFLAWVTVWLHLYEGWVETGVRW